MHRRPSVPRALSVAFALALPCGSACAQYATAPARVEEGAGFGVRAELWPAEVAPGETFELRLVVTPARGRHVYARTQPKGFDVGLPLAVELASTEIEAAGLVPVGDWQESPPTRKRDEVLEVSYDVHNDTAVLTRAFRAPRDVKERKSIAVKGKLTGMSCDSTSCLPPATMAFEPALLVLPELDKASVKPDARCGWGAEAQLHAKEAQRGQRVWLSVFVATPVPRHIYSVHKPTEIGFPTKIALELPEGFKQAGPIGEPTPIEKKDPGLGDLMYLHEGRVRFFVPIDVAPDAKLGAHPIKVRVEAMSCDDEGCLPPAKKEFTLELAVKEA